jgi:hypothetical protein
MLATFAFDVCHDVYCAAREAIDAKIPTLSPESCGKYEWRPDRLPRLAEYVCDFARAGERALDGSGGSRGSKGSEGKRAGAPSDEGITRASGTGSGKARGASTDNKLNATRSCNSLMASALRNSFSALDSRNSHRPSHSHNAFRTSPSRSSFRASRMAMFYVYYLGGADYQSARRHLGISEFTWADWAEEIRRLVGRELTRAGLFPPSKYFREASEKAS